MMILAKLLASVSSIASVLLVVLAAAGHWAYVTSSLVLVVGLVTATVHYTKRARGGNGWQRPTLIVEHADRPPMSERTSASRSR